MYPAESSSVRGRNLLRAASRRLRWANVHTAIDASFDFGHDRHSVLARLRALDQLEEELLQTRALRGELQQACAMAHNQSGDLSGVRRPLHGEEETHFYGRGIAPSPPLPLK